MALDTLRDFRRWFWRPPRAHGEVLHERRVSNLELLYDLVYIVVINQSTQALAKDVSVGGLINFVVVFGLIWIGWVNGSLYLELHGREDGRTRSYVFVQMGILALLAVFTRHATDADPTTNTGASFALAYAAFLAVICWLFYSVRRLDVADVARVTGAYAKGLAILAIVLGASAFLAPEPRLVVWTAFSVLWIAAMLALGVRSRSFSIGITPTDSMVERFGLFTIIVLGEVVVGVINGLSSAPHDVLTVGTGILALVIGLGFWWIFFDIVGGRKPRDGGRYLTSWILSHLPITLGIAAAGAGMVSLIENAEDPQTPDPTAWLIVGSVALVLLGEVLNAASLEDSRRLPAVYRPLNLSLVVGALLALALGVLHSAPWVVALGLGVILVVLWFLAVMKFMRVSEWPPGAPATER